MGKAQAEPVGGGRSLALSESLDEACQTFHAVLAVARKYAGRICKFSPKARGSHFRTIETCEVYHVRNVAWTQTNWSTTRFTGHLPKPTKAIKAATSHFEKLDLFKGGPNATATGGKWTSDWVASANLGAGTTKALGHISICFIRGLQIGTYCIYVYPKRACKLSVSSKAPSPHHPHQSKKCNSSQNSRSSSLHIPWFIARMSSLFARFISWALGLPSSLVYSSTSRHHLASQRFGRPCCDLHRPCWAVQL